MPDANPYGQLANGSQPTNVGGAPVTIGPAGFWLDATGGVAATDPSGKPQVTPGMRDNPESAIYYDEGKDLYYNRVKGQKLYQSPVSYKGQPQGTGHGATNPGGSLLKTGGTWNPQTGTFDQGTNWANILSMVVAGVLTAGAADAIMGVGAGTTAAAASSGVVPEGAGAAPVLEGISAGSGVGATTIPEVAPLAGSAAAGAGPIAATTSPFATTAGAANAALPGLASGSEFAASGLGATPPPVPPPGGGGSSAPSWLGPAVGAGLSAVGGIAGASIAAGANKDAAAIQAKTAADALAYEKERDAYTRATEANRYGAMIQQRAPYVAGGQAAEGQMVKNLGLPSVAGMNRYGIPPAASAPPQAPPPAQGSLNTGTVIMQLPTGEMQPVPAHLVSTFQQRGAQVVAANG